MAELSKPLQKQSHKQVRSKEAETEQAEFEREFFGKLLQAYPEYVDGLRAYGNLLTRTGCFEEGLDIDRRLVCLRPQDAVAHYNLACSYCLLGKHEQTLTVLRRAFELGYDDFAYLRKDRDLESIKGDRRFKVLVREFDRR
jgi:tetratricopeptide (TPR) repeat protein